MSLNSLFRRCNDTWFHKENGMLPCGKCAACKQRIKNEWTTRMVLEAKHSMNAWFVTFTYSDENLPRKEGYTVLDPRDMTLMIKRVRKAESSKSRDLLKGRRFKYVWFGEYGEKTHRPHYHAIFYNLSKHTADRLHRHWKLGSVDVQTPRNIKACHEYTAKYIIKIEDFRHFKVPPMKRQSRNIGLSFLLRNPLKVENGLIQMDGYMVPLPKNWRHFWYRIEGLANVCFTNEYWRNIRDLSEVQLEIEQQEAMERLLDLVENDHRSQWELIEAQREEYKRKIIKDSYKNETL